MYVFLHICIYTVCMHAETQRPGKGIRCPKLRSCGSCVTHCGGWELNSKCSDVLGPSSLFCAFLSYGF